MCAYSHNNKLHKKCESTNFNWQKISLFFLSWHVKQSMTTKQYTTITNAFLYILEVTDTKIDNVVKFVLSVWLDQQKLVLIKYQLYVILLG